VLQNEDTIRPGMFKLLQDYLLGDARAHLTKDGENILVNTIKIRGVERSALDSMVSATQGALDNPAMVKVAINAAIDTLNPKNKKQ